MSKEIRIGATEAIPDAPAFSVYRDSAGILIGVRDNAAPQFAVSRDADGILLSAWPAVPATVLMTSAGMRMSTPGDGAMGLVLISGTGGVSPSVRSTAATAYPIYEIHNPHPANKPAGLTVGDLIVILLASDSGVPSSGPSGFTQDHQSSVDVPRHRITLYTKTADAGDVAAADFPVDNSGGLNMWSTTWAVTDWSSVKFAGSGGSTSVIREHETFITVGVAVGNSLALFGASAWSQVFQWHVNGPPIPYPTWDGGGGGWFIYNSAHVTWPGES